MIGITTSGKSRNVLNAFSAAKDLGLYFVCLKGSPNNDSVLNTVTILDVASEITRLIQVAHVVIYHYICGQIELRMM